MQLSHFSRVQLCATPQTAAHQAPPSLGFSRQEHWSGLPLPVTCSHQLSNSLKDTDQGLKWSEVAQSCPTLCDPMDCSLPGSSVHEVFQSRILQWVAISFSRGSSRPRDRTRVSHIIGRRFTVWATLKHSLKLFLQEANPHQMKTADCEHIDPGAVETRRLMRSKISPWCQPIWEFYTSRSRTPQPPPSHCL